MKTPSRLKARRGYVLRQLAECGPEVVSFAIEKHYLKAYLPDGTYRHIVGTLSEVLEALPPRSFVRISPGAAVNPAYIADAPVQATGDGYTLQIKLRNGQTLKCATSYILRFASNTLLTAQ